jgi:hypothetical protein
LETGKKPCLFRPFWHSVTRRYAHAESEVCSRLPTNCERDALGPDDPRDIPAGSEPTLAKRCRDRLKSSDGPFCRESLPYPYRAVTAGQLRRVPAGWLGSPGREVDDSPLTQAKDAVDPATHKQRQVGECAERPVPHQDITGAQFRVHQGDTRHLV